jgi:uncharacterized RDD family membrane protein YckC
MLLSGRMQRLGDLAARTFVIVEVDEAEDEEVDL